MAENLADWQTRRLCRGPPKRARIRQIVVREGPTVD
jgi:hypothetical protein